MAILATFPCPQPPTPTLEFDASVTLYTTGVVAYFGEYAQIDLLYLYRETMTDLMFMNGPSDAVDCVSSV